MYDQNQEDILEYARAIIANNYPPGVLMIDDNWQEDYGKWNFHQGRFSDPKMMMDSLHDMGFKVMLWVCPFISPDCDVYRELDRKGLLMKDEDSKSAMVRWWNGVSAELDLSNPDAGDWLNKQFDHLMDEYGVNGFKLDGGDPIYYKGLKSHKDILPDEHTRLWGEIGLRYPLNEYRAMYKMGGQPLAERLRDKAHKWSDLNTLIPNMLLQGINGYVFGCPDTIGGGEFTSFLSGAQIDQELIVRSAQVHALMPMMQFSVAPWRILDKENHMAVQKAVALRMKFVPYIMRLTENAALTNQPVVRYLEYSYPHQGYANIRDEFLLGDSILVAPIVEKNKYLRNVMLPEGNWEYIDGKKYQGPAEIEVPAPIDVLPYFIKN
jgi:alpha-glucosidase